MKDSRFVLTMCDVLLLADVFEKVRSICPENYGLCPSHYLRAQALSWNAMLSITKVELNIVSGVDLYLFFEKGLRGGVVFVKHTAKQTIHI